MRTPNIISESDSKPLTQLQGTLHSEAKKLIKDIKNLAICTMNIQFLYCTKKVNSLTDSLVKRTHDYNAEIFSKKKKEKTNDAKSRVNPYFMDPTLLN